MKHLEITSTIATRGGDLNKALTLATPESRKAIAELIAKRATKAKASRVLLKACKLALLELERNSYQKKADSDVIDCLRKSIKLGDETFPEDA